MKQAHIIFVKYPIEGHVKSRLGIKIGYELAARFYAAFVLDMLAGIDIHKLDTLIFFDPKHHADKYKSWLGERTLMPQRGTDLGQRMHNAFQDVFELGYDRCILTGSDLPELTASEIEFGLTCLKSNEACVGPAKDGGYYLIGFQKNVLTEAPFLDMKWSTPNVFTETVQRLNNANLKPAILTVCNDIDTVQDLDTLINSKKFQQRCPNTFAVSLDYKKFRQNSSKLKLLE